MAAGPGVFGGLFILFNMFTEFFNFLLLLVYVGTFLFLIYVLKGGFLGAGLMSNSKSMLSIMGLPGMFVEFFIMGPFFTGPPLLPFSFCGVGSSGFSFWQLFGKEELFYKGSEVGGSFFLAESSYFSDPVFYILFFQISDFLIFLGLDTSVSLLYFFISRCEISGIFEQGPIECLLLLKCLFSVVDITNTNLVFWISCVVVYMEWDYMMCLDEDGTYDFFLWKELKTNLFMASGLVLDIPEEFLLVYSESSRSNFNHYVATSMDFTHFYFSFHPYFKDYEDTSFEGVKLDFLSVQSVKYSRLVFLSPISNFKSKSDSYSTILNGVSLTPFSLLYWSVFDCWSLFINLKFVSVLGPILYPVVGGGSPVVRWELLNSISSIGIFELNCFLQGFMVLGDNWVLEETGLIPVEHALWGSLGVNKDNLFITVSGSEEVPYFLGEYGVSHMYEVFGGSSSGIKDSSYLGVNMVKLHNPSFFSGSKILGISSIFFPFYVKYIFGNFCSSTCLSPSDFKVFSVSEAKKNVGMYHSMFSTRSKLLEGCPKVFDLGTNGVGIVGEFLKKLEPKHLSYLSDGEMSLGGPSCLTSKLVYDSEISKMNLFLSSMEKSFSGAMRLGVITCSGSYKDSYCSCVGSSFKTSSMCVCVREFVLVGGSFVSDPNFFSWPSLPSPVFLSYVEYTSFLNFGVGNPYFSLSKEDLVLDFMKKAGEVTGFDMLGKVPTPKSVGGLDHLHPVLYFLAPKTFFNSKANQFGLNFMSMALEVDLESRGVFDFEVGIYTNMFFTASYPLDFFFLVGDKLLSFLGFMKDNKKLGEISSLGLSDVSEKDSFDFLVSKEFSGKNFDWLDIGVEYTSWSHKLLGEDLKEFYSGPSYEGDFSFVKEFLLPFESIPYFSKGFLTAHQESLFDVGGGLDPFEDYLEKFCFLLVSMCGFLWYSCSESLGSSLGELQVDMAVEDLFFCGYFIWGLMVVFEYSSVSPRGFLSFGVLFVFLKEPLEDGGFGIFPGCFKALLGCFGSGLSLEDISENYGGLFLSVISKEDLEGFEEVENGPEFE